jgi:hypothetical protein
VKVPTPKGKPSFAEYKAMRTQLEKSIADDPTILRQRADVLASYRLLVTATANAKEKFRPTEKGPAAALLNERLREADVYEATWKMVLDLHKVMNR